MTLTQKITDRLALITIEIEKLEKEKAEMNGLLDLQKKVESQLTDHFDKVVEASSIRPARVAEPTPLTVEKIDEESAPAYVTAEQDKKDQIEVIVERSREGLKDNLKSNLPVQLEGKISMHDYWRNLIEKPNSVFRKVDDVWIKHRENGTTVIRLVDGIYTESRYTKDQTYSTKNPKPKVIEQPKPNEPVNYEW